MNIVLLLIAGVLPAIVLWLYIWRQDPQPEPTSWLLKAVWYGVAVCIPVALVEGVIEAILFGEGGQPTTLFGTTVQAFFVAAVPEECAKLLALWLLLRRNPWFDEHFDGIVYAVSVGLGFAALENVSYLLSNIDDWYGMAVSRAFLAVPGHYAFAVLMGYYYSLWYFTGRTPRYAMLMLLVPVVAHGVYDAIALSGQVNQYVGAVSFIVLVFFCVKMHKHARQKMLAHLKHDQEREGDDYVEIV